MKIINITNENTYLKEYYILCSKQWGTKKVDYEKYAEDKIKNKNDKIISVLALIDDELIGFISLFKYDGDERIDLTPWYATMYVKEKYRKNGYSKILNDAILEEAKNLGYNKVYLKSNLKNYYEKFGARFVEKLSNGENLFYIDIR